MKVSPRALLGTLFLLHLPACKDETSSPKAIPATGGSAAAAQVGAQATAQPNPAQPAVPSANDEERERKKREEEDFAKYGFCELQVEGALNGTGRSPGGKHAFGSDYFFTEEELVMAEKFLPKKPGETKRDPRIYVVIVNCSNDVLTVNFSPGVDTKYADMPFKAGKYKIGNKKGEMAALVTERTKNNNGKVFRVSSGEFEFKRWDAAGAAGEFRFEAKEMFGGAGVLRVKGSFDMKCPKGEGQCKRG